MSASSLTAVTVAAGCNPSCLPGYVCVLDGGAYVCQSPATTSCNVQLCPLPQQCLLVNGVYMCVVPSDCRTQSCFSNMECAAQADGTYSCVNVAATNSIYIPTTSPGLFAGAPGWLTLGALIGIIIGVVILIIVVIVVVVMCCVCAANRGEHVEHNPSYDFDRALKTNASTVLHNFPTPTDIIRSDGNSSGVQFGYSTDPAGAAPYAVTMQPVA
jgi:hypothetical protein